MAAAVSQLCVWQGSTVVHSSGFISTRAVKVEQISPLFHLYLYLFFKSEEQHPFFANLACQVNCTDIYGSRLMAKEKSTFQISSLLLSSFISNIYTPEKGYYWQNQPNGLKVKGIKKSTPMSSNYCTEKKILSTSIKPEAESSKLMSVNVRESNFDDEVRVTWILVRTSTEPQRGQNEDKREH